MFFNQRYSIRYVYIKIMSKSNIFYVKNLAKVADTVPQKHFNTRPLLFVRLACTRDFNTG